MQSFREFLETINEDKKKKVSSASELKKIIKSRRPKGNKVDFNDLDVSGITDFSYVFEDYKYEPLVETWDVSNAKTMDSMFLNCYNFNCDISKWDVSNLQNASSMFYGCEKFNQDLSRWNVKKLTKAAGMFRLCSSFNSDLSRWDVSNVLDFQYMFERTKVDPAKIEKWASKINPKVGSVELRLKEKPSWEIKILKDRMEKRDAAERKAQAEYNALEDDPLWPGKKIPRGGRFTGD